MIATIRKCFGIAKTGLAEIPAEFLGVPVRFRPNTWGVACANGFWPFKRIHVNPRWFRLDSRLRIAVLLHEAAHCFNFHYEKRWSWRWMQLFCPQYLAKKHMRQEFEADAFAAHFGFGPDLLNYGMSQMRYEDSTGYSHWEERCGRLVSLLISGAIHMKNCKATATEPDPPANPVAEARKQRVLAMLDERMGIRYAAVAETKAEAGAVVLALAIPEVGTCEMRIPREKYDPLLLLELIERHGGAIH